MDGKETSNLRSAASSAYAEVTSSASSTRASGTASDDRRRKGGPPTSILLIGSTGNGKSSLGNFLLDPKDEHIIGKNQTFQTGRTNMPETTIVQCASDAVDPSLLVVDTPGLNDSEDKDFSHMIDIVSKLRELESITACILCVKFDSKIDEQYKATVDYYRRLLPSLFERNVVIVMTSFLTDEHSESMRQRQEVDVEAIVRNAQREVMESGKLTFTPQVFLIDSVPVNKDEREVSEYCRSSILGYIRKSLAPISIKDMKVAKTTALKQRDGVEIVRLDGEIHGYYMRLVEVNKAAESALDGIERKENDITRAKGEVKRIKGELQEKDSTTTFTAKTWSLSNSWKWFQKQSEAFAISSSWPIVEYTRWDNGHLKWTEFEWSRDPGRAYGKVEGEWFRGLYANVTLLAQKREKFKEEIPLLQQELSYQVKELKDLIEDLDEYKKAQSEYQKEINLLHEYIKERSIRKEELLTDPIPIEEASQRLADLAKK